MSKTGLVLSAGLALVLLAGCERSSAVAPKGGGSASYEDRGPTSSVRAASDEGRQDEAPVKMVAGKPMWSSSRKGSAEENAQRSFDRNGEAFGARNLEDFVQKAHAFIDHPPAGAASLKRSNGDVLIYDAKSNVFAVASKDGAPRAMFKPDQGAAYWEQQKAREAKRQTARAERKDRGDTDG